MNRLIPAVLVLLGIAAFLYPIAATQYNNVKQQAFADAYTEKVSSVRPEALAAELATARTYNEVLPGTPILDPWLSKAAANPNSPDYETYMGQLSTLPAMARIRVPQYGIDLPVFHGTSDEVLAKGVGHLYGTSLPVGGTSTHAVLTSHTGLSNATLFDRLKEAKVGDMVLIDVFGETLAYQVDQLKVVLPTETKDLTVAAGKDLVTLVTCTPYAVNTHRLLVRAHRVPFDATVQAKAAEVHKVLLQPWMYWLLAGAGVSTLVFGGLVVGARRRSRVTRADRS